MLAMDVNDDAGYLNERVIKRLLRAGSLLQRIGVIRRGRRGPAPDG